MANRIDPAEFPNGESYRIAVQDHTPHGGVYLRIEDQDVKAAITIEHREAVERLRDWLTAWLERHGE